MAPSKGSFPRRRKRGAFRHLTGDVFASNGVLTLETYDILMLVVVVSAGLFGAFKGFAWQLASIASIVISYFVAYRYREPVSQSIVAEPPWNQFLAMLILFVGTSLVVWVAFNMVRGTIDRMKLKEFDRQIGALFGLLKGGLYCTLITLFAVTLMGEQVREKIVASKSGRFIARNLDRSESVIPQEIHEFLQPYLDRLDSEFEGTPGYGAPGAIDGSGFGQLGEGVGELAGQLRDRSQGALNPSGGVGPQPSGFGGSPLPLPGGAFSGQPDFGSGSGPSYGSSAQPSFATPTQPSFGAPAARPAAWPTQ